MTRIHRIPRQILNELCVAASVDYRTASRAYAEGSAAVRGLAAVRLARAMVALGIPDPAPTPLATVSKSA
jgi:hypothetical protein